MSEEGGGNHSDVTRARRPTDASAATSSQASTHVQNKHESMLVSRPTYARAEGTEDLMRAAKVMTEEEKIGDVEHYFIGPRDLERHSKLPYFLRLHGSVLPKMLLSLLLIGGWAAAITAISIYVYPLGVSSLLLTILGFLVGLSLSFINSTAYERWSDGRKAWANLTLQGRNLARLTWIHIQEREGEHMTSDLLAKVSALNLILAFAISLKHRLRFEPHAHYKDLSPLISHVSTFANTAHAASPIEHTTSKRPKSIWKETGEFLGLPFAQSNPRKEMKRAAHPLGNLPLELLTHLGTYYEHTLQNGTLSSPVVYGQLLGHLASLTDVLTQAERVSNTPLPEAYSIVISQITLLYVLTLPFQLYGSLGWITIPGTMAAAYIILGMAAIGHEIESPFGRDVNDLPLDAYCRELGQELDVIMAGEGEGGRVAWWEEQENKVLWPLSESGVGAWRDRGVEEIREALRARCVVGGRAARQKRKSRIM